MPETERPFPLRSGDLALEAMLHDGAGELAALVLHPHPRYGGDMHNHVVVALCRALAALGATTLRFNFRGTGNGEGAFDCGRGEANDARAALGALAAEAPRARLIVIGYSFGAGVAASIAGDVEIAGLVLVSLPALTRPVTLPADVPELVITGELDAIASHEALRPLCGGAAHLVIVPGVDHAWWPGVDILAREVSSFAATLISR